MSERTNKYRSICFSNEIFQFQFCGRFMFSFAVKRFGKLVLTIADYPTIQNKHTDPIQNKQSHSQGRFLILKGSPDRIIVQREKNLTHQKEESIHDPFSFSSFHSPFYNLQSDESYKSRSRSTKISWG